MQKTTIQRKIPFITFCIKPNKKAWINLAGCNFDCKGCFALAKDDVGRPFTVEAFLNLFVKSCMQIYGEMVYDVVITGGEPTLNPTYLLNLIKGLQKLSIKNIAISTNGYMLNEKLVKLLKTLQVNLVKLDIKMYDEKLHRWYTGKSNKNVLEAAKLLHKYNINFYVRTILMPGIVDHDEVERIAYFLSSIDRRIPYRIYEFAPSHAKIKVTRKPTLEEMVEAYHAAKKYLDHVEAIPASQIYNSEYAYIEVRDGKLMERFKWIDKASKLAIKTWNMKYLTFDEVLGSSTNS
ncbi:radical SAM protein [Candidatus Bathyarchaeota archaeon]|nr:MAG: radical SAM protein [Candidatus Bathyarchaeota archaeon]